MARKEQNPEQIARVDGKSCFLEVMSSSFGIGKIRINFRQYDMNAQQGNRTTGKIDIYMGYKDFDYLYQGIMFNGNGYLLNEVFNNQYGATIFRGGKKDQQGNVTAKELKLQAGQKKPFILVAEEGPGNENKMGGFSIIRGNNANIKRVMIPLEFADMIHICNSTNNAIIAYRAAQEIKKSLDFESGKIKDILVNIAMLTGCAQNTIMDIVNREMPRPSWNNGSYENNDNYSSGNQSNQNGYYQGKDYESNSGSFYGCGSY